jgi:hypothetical protein
MEVILFSDVADTVGYGKYAGTYKIATEIRNKGYSCQVIDLFSYYTYEELIKIIEKYVSKETLMIGFSCTLMEKRINGQVLNFGRPTEEFYSIVDIIKKKNQKIKICLGGARMTIHSYWDGVDYVIINKGDRAIIALLDHLKYNTSIKIKHHFKAFIIDGNDYAYSQNDFEHSSINYITQDIIFEKESLPVEVARGCIFSCAFCHFDLIGKKIGDWQKNKNILRNELVKNYEMFGTTHFMFTDELINESLIKMHMIHEVANELPFKLTYTSYARLDLIWRYPEMRELLLESGAKSLAFGIETMNAEVGRQIGKGLGSDKIKHTLEYCAETWKGEIITSSNFIVGLPGETESSIMNTVNYLTSKDCPLDVFGFLPLYIRSEEDGRGSSKIDKDPKKYGYILEEGKWHNNSMSFTRAQQLVKEIASDPLVKNRSKLSAATWIGRIINLGYSIEDIFQMLTNNALTKDQLQKQLIEKSNIVKNDYFLKLISL